MVDIFHAIILGLVQGLSEFLPISSSGHLILMRQALGINDSHALAFDAVLQLATGLATLVYFFPDLWRLFNVFLRMVGRIRVDQKEKVLLQSIIIGTIPALILGLALEKYMESAFRSPLLVALVLVAGSGLFAYAEYASSFYPATTELTLTRGFMIGLFQAVAVIPGFSRSGATISGGLILGLPRYEAARFSFLLSVPIVVGSGAKKLIELILHNQETSLVPLAIGATVAFFTGLVAIHFMLAFLRNHTLWPFVWYRIGLATLVILFLFVGI